MPLPLENKIFNYSDYLTWPEDESWEILDGIPYMKAAPSRIHQEILMELTFQIKSYLRDKNCRVYPAPFCVRLNLDKNIYNENNIKNVVEPDITIVCDKSKLDDRGLNGSPDMVVEIISPSSRKLDSFIKLNKYEQAGVKEYWLIDPTDKLLTVFTLQDSNKYGRPEMYTEEDTVKVSIFKDLTIDLNTVLNID